MACVIVFREERRQCGDFVSEETSGFLGYLSRTKGVERCFGASDLAVGYHLLLSSLAASGGGEEEYPGKPSSDKASISRLSRSTPYPVEP